MPKTRNPKFIVDVNTPAPEVKELEDFDIHLDQKSQSPLSPVQQEEHALEEEELEEGEEQEGEEEEEDEGDYYEEEGEGEEDDDQPKKSKKQIEKELESNHIRLVFLKALAFNIYQDIEELGSQVGIREKHYAQKTVQKILGMITETFHDPDYPTKVLNYYNNSIPPDYPKRVWLEPSDINELATLFDVLEKRRKGEVKTVHPSKVFGDNDGKGNENSKTINDSAPIKKPIAMMDMQSYQQAQQQHEQQQQEEYDNQTASPIQMQQQQQQSPIILPSMQQQQQQPRANSLEFFVKRHENADIGIMEYVLSTTPNNRPQQVPIFIDNFERLYMKWLNNPMALQEHLFNNFGPIAGKSAFNTWRDLRDDYYQKQYGYTPGNMTLASDYSTGGMGMGMMGNGGLGMGNITPEMQWEMELERRAEKRFTKMMRTMEMTMMDRMMNSQIPTQPGQMGNANGNMEEVLDSSGKVVKRIFYNNTPQNGNANQDITNSPVFSAVTSLFSTMLNNQGKEKEILLQKLNTPDTSWKELAETFIKSSFTTQNPTAMVGQLIDIADKIRPQQQQNNDVSKSIEATKLEVDSKIALGELALKRLELEHNFQMDEKQSSQDNNNVDRWLDALQGLGESVIKPVAMKFVEGMGQGKFPIGGPLGQMLGQQPQQQEQQLTPEQQQAIAMMQREQAMRQHRINQMQNDEPPMPNPQQMQQQGMPRPEVMPPIRPMPNNPRPTQQQQQMHQQQQSFEEQLGNMSLEQLQDINYRIEMEDVKKERIKNHIKALINSKKGNQNPRAAQQQQQQQQVPQQMTPQQQEAENILNFNQEPQEEEDDYDEEEDYEIPVASGLPKNEKVKDLKKNTVNMYENESDDDNLTDNTTSLIAKKKLTNQEKALLATGQLSPEYVKDIEDDEDYDEDEEDDNGIQIAGVKNASDVQKQQQLEERREKAAAKKQKEKTASPKKKTPTKKIAEDVKEFDEPLDDVIEETDSVLNEADEIIPSDDV